MSACRSLIAVASLVCLAACGSVPLTSLPSLMRVDARTTDFSKLAVAVSAPRAIRPVPGGVRVEFRSRIADAPERTDSFSLARVSAPVDLTDIVADGAGGDDLGVYVLTAEDAARMTKARDELMAAKAAGKTATGSLSVNAKLFCHLGDSLPSSLLVTTYLKTSETGRFVPLIRDYDLAAQPELMAGLKQMPACPPPVAATGER